MPDKSLRDDIATATLTLPPALALAGAIAARAANGPGPLSVGRTASGVPSNPVPKGAAGARGGASVPGRNRRGAARGATPTGKPDEGVAVCRS